MSDMKKILSYLNKHVKIMQYAKFEPVFKEDKLDEEDPVILKTLFYSEIVYSELPIYFLNGVRVDRKDLFALAKKALEID